jgi:phosphate transport system protein
MDQTEGHIAKGYDGALGGLRLRVIEMGGLVSDQVTIAVRALLEADTAAAEQVLAREKRINAYDTEIEGECFALLARRAPVATDLRTIIGIGRAVRDLERAGDESKKIARFALAVALAGRDPSTAVHRYLRQMAHRAAGMMRAAVDALDRFDATVAYEVARSDEALDQEFEAAMLRLVTVATEDSHLLRPTIDTVFALKSLERIGDHAKNIAEHVVFMVSGNDIRHAVPAGASVSSNGSGIASRGDFGSS